MTWQTLEEFKAARYWPDHASDSILVVLEEFNKTPENKRTQALF